MKSRVFMYLFIISLLTAIFIYANSKSILDKYEVDINRLKEQQITYKDTIEALYDENLDLLYFNLENNEDALTYFENDGIDTNKIEDFIKDQIYALGETKKEHPLIPFDSEESKMIINKIRLLNHKWIIADFSDGTYWGEVLITYQISKARELTFTLVESLIYPPQNIN